jgi:hypothetical protein
MLTQTRVDVFLKKFMFQINNCKSADSVYGKNQLWRRIEKTKGIADVCKALNGYKKISPPLES